MLTRRRLLFLFLAAVVVGLALAWVIWPRPTVNEEKAAAIHAGMSLADVEEVLGCPADDATPFDLVDHSVTRLWNGHGASLLVVFGADGRVVRTRFMRDEGEAQPSAIGWLGRL